MSSRAIAGLVCAGLLAGVLAVSAGAEHREPGERQQQASQERRDAGLLPVSRAAHPWAFSSAPPPPPPEPFRLNALPAELAPPPPPEPFRLDALPAEPASPPPPPPSPAGAPVVSPPPLPLPPPPPEPFLRLDTLPDDLNTEEYGVVVEAGFVGVVGSPLSTFSIDVDTAAYSNVRRFLCDEELPPTDAVRIEELINYFDYDYPHPEADAPFGIVTEMADAPWAPGHQLVHIGLRSTPVATADLPPNNLVFLLDVSGSMSSSDKLPLLKEALALLVGELRPQDQVAIVVYAGAAGMVLPPTAGTEKATMLDTLSRLEAGGSTAGGTGIRLAYALAHEHFIEAGNNRVILATDGDFNVGVTSDGELVELIERERESGVYLTVLGFGTGNLQDAKMEQLADHGNGNYAYVDSLREARRVLVERMGATLLTVANDVKLQVEFNPLQVKGYRLIGYENRRLRDEEFNDDARDAGDLGAGHSVTALYEIIPADSDEPVPGVDPLRYQQIAPRSGVGVGEVLTVKVRYKRPGESESRLLARTLTRPVPGGEGPSEAFRFASAVAEFGLALRDSPYKGGASYDRAYDRAHEALGTDEDGSRGELLWLISIADGLAEELLSLMRTADELKLGRARSVQVGSGERMSFAVRDVPDGTYRLDAAAGSDGFDPVLYLYRQAGDWLVEIASDDDGGERQLDSRIVARLDGTEEYLVAVEEYNGCSGSVTLSVVPEARD